MAFYTSIAKWYDDIFPFDESQYAFISGVLDPHLAGSRSVRAGKDPVSNRSFLDVGCGTGTLLSAFSDRFKRVSGLDMDEALLSLAAKKLLPGEGKKVDLIEGDMRKLDSLFPNDEFSFIGSFGNTLPHALGPEELVKVLTSIRTLLETDGVFLFQIINYDRILDTHERSLPTIYRGEVSFERLYSLPKSSGLLDFDTILCDPEHEVEIANTVELFPVRKGQIQEYLKSAGFDHVSFFGDFLGNPWTPESFLCIGLCW